MKRRSKSCAVEKSESRAASPARGRAARSDPAKSERRASPVTPRGPAAVPAKQQRGEGGADSEASPSSAESTSHTTTSIESEPVTESTTGSTSLGSSAYESSATSLGATRRTGRGAKAPRGGPSRRRGFKSWWRAHHDNVLVAALGLFIVACVVATALDRWFSVQASVTTTPVASSERKAVGLLDAPASPVGAAAKEARTTTVTAAVASTGPSTKGRDRHRALASTPASFFEAEASSEPGDITSEPYTEATDSTTVRTRSTRGAAVQRRRRPQRRTRASTARRRALESWRRSRGAVVQGGGELLRRKLHSAHRLPVGAPRGPVSTATRPPQQNSGRCGAVRYTFCPRLRREAFYDREMGDCVAVTTAAEQDAEQEVAARAAARRGGRRVRDETPLCNSSPNRFSSMDSCRQSCLRSELPAERCFDKTIFSECRSEHVRSTRWFFDGRRCRMWHFPAGRCPDASAFRTRSQCARMCPSSPAAPKKKHQPDRRCGAPRSQVCSERHLRFPFFADVSSGDGRVRCLKASQATLVGRRCLVAPNRFSGVAQCRAACVRAAAAARPSRPRSGREEEDEATLGKPRRSRRARARFFNASKISIH
ncbi:uncharacterized protein [Dermacentor andersoni]|uniref:uncharacterized protein n=1 Tax=Dermacentor andersoni TaxID=34620 RepID=UPI002155D9F3|nr:uncharacterized protein LOC126516478 [Dermacentor andersoni]